MAQDNGNGNGSGISTWVKVFLGCAATAMLNIFATGRQIGVFEERLAWLRQRQEESFTADERMRQERFMMIAEVKAQVEKSLARQERLETEYQKHLLDVARGAK